MRAFIGVPLDEELVDEVAPIQEELLQYAQTRLVEAEKLHWTVKFLGEIDDSQKEEITDILDTIKTSQNPFTVSPVGVGVFPSVKRPKVVWIGEESGDRFEELMVDVEERTTESGFRKNRHEPTPHLTIGRIRKITNLKGLREMLSRHENTVFGEMMVEELTLYRSTPTTEGHVYDVLHRAELGE